MCMLVPRGQNTPEHTCDQAMGSKLFLGKAHVLSTRPSALQWRWRSRGASAEALLEAELQHGDRQRVI
jgi:hypothetical protein